MEGGKKPYNKGGQVSRFKPLNTQEFMSSSLAKHFFQNVGCLGFCEKIQQVGYHAKLTILFATNLRRDKVTIAGVSFKISTKSITIAIGIPNSGEKWFKNSDLDVQNYKAFIKSHYKDAIEKKFPFGYC